MTGKRVPISRVAEMENVMPPGVLVAIKDREDGDTRHSGTAQTATAFNGCPRKLLIERMLDVYIDPQKLWPARGGQMLHEQFGLEVAAEKNPDGSLKWWTEEMDPDKCVHTGEIWGIEYSWKGDLVRRDWGEIGDWKCSFNRADKWVAPNRKAKLEHSIQLNMGRKGVERTIGRDMRDITMWAYIVGGKWVKTYADYMTDDQMAGVKIGGSKFTAKELFTDVHKAYLRWLDEAARYDGDLYKVPVEMRKKIAREMKLYGTDLWKNRQGGNACTDYCAISKDCDELEGGV